MSTTKSGERSDQSLVSRSRREGEQTWARHYEITGWVAGEAQRVFAHLDDHTRLSSHMSKSSWKMGGGKMQLELDDGQGRRVGSRIRLAGRVFGLTLAVEEVVTLREPPSRKTWETTGTPRLMVIAGYRLGFEITSKGNGTYLS